MIFKKDELRLLWPFYASYLLFSLSSLILPFIIIYFRGLSFSYLQIETILLFAAIAIFLFEVPTGAIADLFGRKLSVLLGFSIVGIMLILVPFIQQYWLVLLAWVIIGIGTTFVSGAQEAWVVDYLKHKRKEKLIQTFFIRVAMIAGVGMILAPFFSAVIVKKFAIRYLWIIQGAGLLFGALFMVLFAKEYFKKKIKKSNITLKDSFKNILNQSKSSIQYTIGHKVLFLFFLALIVASLMGVADDGWQPLLVDLAMPQYFLGYIYSFLGVVAITFPMLTEMLLKKLKHPKYAISTLLFFEMIFQISLIFIYPPLFMFAVIIRTANFGFDTMIYGPISDNYMQKFIPSKKRATIISFKRMLSSLIIALFALPAGFLMDLFGPQKIIAFSALFAIPAIILFLRIRD